MAASPAPDEPVDLCIHLLGGFRVAVAGRAIVPAAWRLRHAAALVKLLALAPGHRLHREHLIERLWPGSPPGAAAGSLKYALHVARRTLPPDPATTTRSWLVWQGDVLALDSPAAIWVDVPAFERAAANARRTGDPDSYQTALDLYAGDLLPEDRYEDWVAGRREALRQEYLALLLRLSEVEVQRGNPAAAIAALWQLVAAEPAHEAARRALMRLYAERGQPDQALRQYEHLRVALARELECEPDSDTRQLHAQIVAGHWAGSVPAAGAVDSGPGWSADAATDLSLPAPVTSFVGREDDLATLTGLLPTTRLLTLTGTGGVGKTRLAIEFARTVAGCFPGGVRLIELEALADPALVPQAVATALGLPGQPSRPVLDHLLAALRTRRLLLVLDNCEHLIAASAGLVEALLRGCPSVQVLATSREPLALQGELTWRVPSLAVPAEASHSPSELAGVPSVQLFVDRVGFARPAFVLTDANAAAVAEVCRRLDGIPLALELAAARVRAFSVQELAARLDERFRLLTGGRRTALPRQQTLRATLDWSYDLLTESERGVLPWLSVCAGGFTLAAAEAIVAGTAVGPADVVEVLPRLVDKSLIQTEEDNGETRYRLLETVRQYALERLEEQGQANAARDRHLAWFAALAERAEPHVFGGDEQVAWLARLDVEGANLRAALEWSLSRDPETGLRLAGHLWQSWKVRGRFAEGRRWLDALLERTCEPGPARVNALLGTGSLARLQDPAVARASLEASLALGRALGTTKLVAFALRELGHVSIALGEPRQTEALIAEALATVRAAGDRRGLGATLFLQCDWLTRTGDYRGAQHLGEESLALLREVGERVCVAHHIVAASGRSALWQGDVERAEALLREALDGAREVGAGSQTAIIMLELGMVAFWRGDLAQAAEHIEQSLAHSREIESVEDIVYALVRLGRLALVRGDLPRAMALLDECQALATAHGGRRVRAEGCLARGRLAWHTGDGVAATAAVRAGLALWREIREPLPIIESLECLAMSLGGLGQAATAARLLGAAAAQRQALNTPLPPVERASYEAAVTAARSTLGDGAFDAAWSDGATVPLDDIIAGALAEG